MAVDAFGQELQINDIVVYAVGQGRAAGGLRFGRVKNLESPVFSNFGEDYHKEFDDAVGYDLSGNRDDETGVFSNKPSEENPWSKREYRKYHYVVDGYREESARRIGGFNQVMRVNDISKVLKNKPDLLKFIWTLFK